MGGMNHFQLPYTREKQNATGRFGNVATLTLIRMMMDDGSKAKQMEAQIFGGAFNPRLCHKNIGGENIMVARKILMKTHVRIISEDVGGEIGRKIVFNTTTNEVAVLKVDKIREGDWYPYEDNR